MTIVRSEYSLRQVFGPMKEVVARLPSWGGIIADDGAWGHVDFYKECKAQGKHAVLGCRFTHEAQPVIVVPRSPAGLRGLYQTIAEGFSVARAQDEDWAVVALGRSSVQKAMRAYSPGVNRPAPTTSLAFSDNLFPSPGDREAWALMLGRLARARPIGSHILSGEELALEGADPAWVLNMRELIEGCDTPLPVATNIRFPVADPQAMLVELCASELIRRNLNHAPYDERLRYELRLIEEKKFADYFLVIADMMHYAKQHMLVGPARGSSAGSLVCWLTRITEIDPIKHGLIFERFIDVNRMDLPDIDIDFPDLKRELVVQYLANKYGTHNVAHIGTVIRYKPKSALTDVAKQGGVPLYELDKMKDVMIERSSGDSRASSCLADSLQGMEVGKALVTKYPVLMVACRLENHARSAGVHAAGIIVCNEPVNNFCGVKEGNAQLDKKMAEAVNMLKIDALGLRTLSVIEECCEMIGMPMEQMYTLPLEDPLVFELLNQRRFGGIFQYEGIALQSVAKQISIDCFEDVAAITALARPGPLSSGETTRWVLGKNAGTGEALFPELDPYTKETFGCILYQEQVMTIVRELGNFSWADTSIIRKVMSNRQGDEAFGKFGLQFLAGAQTHGISEVNARKIWKAINTMGSWAFNRCTSGETLVRMVDQGGEIKKWMRIDELYRMYVSHPSPWIKQRKTMPRVWSLGTDERAWPQRIKIIHKNGKKKCIRLRFSHGAEITCTPNHKFLINDQWLQAGKAKIGDEFVIADYDIADGRKGLRPSHLKNGRKAIEAAYEIRPCEDCGVEHRRMELHHNDFEHGDLRPWDLTWLCPGCHKRRHYARGRVKRNEKGLKISRVKLTGKKVVGMKETYDIELPGEHNYVVNGGIITHNSHAVAYGLVSYWTAWLKAHHTVPFAVANLRHARDDDSALALLRELMREGGIEFLPVDPALSTDRWEYAEGKLLGPLTGITGMGVKTSRDILIRRKNGIKLTPRQERLLTGKSVFEDFSPAHKLWGDLYEHPEAHNIKGRLYEIDEVDTGDPEQQFIVLGKLIKKNLRDLNEEKYLVRRNGKRVPEGQHNMLLFHLEDDTGRMLCCVNARKYSEIGQPIVEGAAIGQWLAVRGTMPTSFKMLQVQKVRWLNKEPPNG